MKIETDLKKIEETARKKEDENWEFRSFLKGYHMETQEMDSLVHRLLEIVSREIDCKTCGNCCRAISPGLNHEDIKRFSRGLTLDAEDFKQQFLKKPDKSYSEKLIFNKLPCPFLDGNLCSHYELRPKACRSFPHLHKDEFVARLIGVVNNCDVCPIVFNVYEQLKDRLWIR